MSVFKRGIVTKIVVTTLVFFLVFSFFMIYRVFSSEPVQEDYELSELSGSSLQINSLEKGFVEDGLVLLRRGGSLDFELVEGDSLKISLQKCPEKNIFLRASLNLESGEVVTYNRAFQEPQLVSSDGVVFRNLTREETNNLLMDENFYEYVLVSNGERVRASASVSEVLNYSRGVLTFHAKCEGALLGVKEVVSQ